MVIIGIPTFGNEGLKEVMNQRFGRCSSFTFVTIENNEITPSGIRDLKRALEMVTQFNIPFGIVINKADLKSASQKQLNSYIKKSNHEVLGRINIDLSIPEAMSYAEPVVDYAPESDASQAINNIYAKLKSISLRL